MHSFKRLLAVAVVGGGVAGLALPAEASMVLSYQETSSGVTGGGAFTGFPSSGGQGTYTDTFTAPTQVISSSPSPGYGFYDDFFFSVPNSVSADSITSTISLGQSFQLSNLDVRLYRDNGYTAPVLGAPPGGAVEGWGTQINIGPGMTGTVQVLDTTISQPGEYVLEVRGIATGTNGGSYTGQINITPVPLPAALPLLLSALGLLGGVARKRFS